MTAAAERAGCVNMVGFNYVRTPATQLARQIVASGEIGRITLFRGEHTEDFLADPTFPRTGARAGAPTAIWAISRHIRSMPRWR